MAKGAPTMPYKNDLQAALDRISALERKQKELEVRITQQEVEIRRLQSRITQSNGENSLYAMALTSVSHISLKY